MTKKNLHTLADRLQYVIEQRNYSHNDVARLCGIKQGSVSYILAKNLDRSKLSYQIANGLDISYNWLVTGEGSMKPELIYPVAKFDTIFDCIKYSQKPDVNEVEEFVYTERSELANHCFALDINGHIIAICSFAEKQKSTTNMYLNITDVLSGKLKLSNKKESQAAYPVVELRILDFSGQTEFNPGSLIL
ncbi:helix-turn-helix domain-containing protein [Facilibium subflavum]|uniref:helix-turn-helix domain-containing protein n=1 Tax=Facilibium subflavum TaxID=2219058 RepID=UPI0013C2CBA6|nr:helix-turn-helix domain-containing protein [Facilibium subflavum]